MYRRIMVPLDGSDLAELALPHAEDLARKEISELDLIMVVEQFEMPVHGGVVFDEETIEQIQHNQEAAAQDYLNKLADRLRAKGIDVRTSVLTGKIADSLVDYVIVNSIELIIMATHGRSGVSRWIWGSIAEKILHASTVPILLIHAAGKLQ